MDVMCKSVSDAILSCEWRKLGEFLDSNADILKNEACHLICLREELRSVQAFVAEASRDKVEGDQSFDIWVSDARRIACAAMDVLDTFSLQKNIDKTSKSGIMECSEGCLLEYHEALLYGIRKKIISLKDGLNNMCRMMKRFDFERRVSASSPVRIMATSYCVAPSYRCVVALDEDFVALTNLLIQEEPNRCVILLRGMGGLGKTSMAHKIYNCSIIKNRFECRGWVHVTRECQTKETFRSIIRSFRHLDMKDWGLINVMDELDLSSYMHEYLEGKQYLVVIDNLRDGRLWWNKFRSFFPENNNGSRVIITTRNQMYYMEMNDKIFSHELRFLNDEESWVLFCKTALPREGFGSVDMVPLGREMVAKCGGLPLAINILGGILWRKKYLSQWLAVKERIWQDLGENSEISQVFSLSYHDLSSHMKLCFLYLGMFPEDHVIDAKKLISMWIAEGFIPQEGGALINDVAEDYLIELNDRSLIQVMQWKEGKIVTFKVHNLLRGFIVQKARELDILGIFDPCIEPFPPFTCRRVAVHSHIFHYFSFDHSCSRVHSLVLFTPDGELLEAEHIESISRNFKSLRLLDMDQVNVSTNCQIPGTIGNNLLHLKLLRLP